MHASLVLPVRPYTTRAPSRLHQRWLQVALASTSSHGEEKMARDGPPETLRQRGMQVRRPELSKWQPRIKLAAPALQLSRAGTNPLGELVVHPDLQTATNANTTGQPDRMRLPRCPTTSAHAVAGCRRWNKRRVCRNTHEKKSFTSVVTMTSRRLFTLEGWTFLLILSAASYMLQTYCCRWLCRNTL